MRSTLVNFVSKIIEVEILIILLSRALNQQLLLFVNEVVKQFIALSFFNNREYCCLRQVNIVIFHLFHFREKTSS